jgi:hypothetical protein
VTSYDRSESTLRALDFVVSDLAWRVDEQLDRIAVMRKLTLPREHAGALLEELDLEDVSARTLFPDFAGVVDYLRYQRPAK